MARGINKVILVGHVGQDLELKYTQSGTAIVQISLATTSVRTNKDTQQKVEHTEWHRLKAFNRLAEIFGEYVKKGSQIYIEGRLKTQKWQDQTGADRYTTEIIVDEMQMLGMRDNQQQPTYSSPQQPVQTPQVQNSAPQQPVRMPNNMPPQQQQPVQTDNRHNPNGTQTSPMAPAPYNTNATNNFDDDIPF